MRVLCSYTDLVLIDTEKTMYTLSVVENDDVDVYYYEPECFDDMQNAIIKFEAIGCECSYYFEHNE
jgi:hypothetical protein